MLTLSEVSATSELAGRKHPRFLEAVDEVTRIFLARGVLHRADDAASSGAVDREARKSSA
jgi:hypothetical protein